MPENVLQYAKTDPQRETFHIQLWHGLVLWLMRQCHGLMWLLNSKPAQGRISAQWLDKTDCVGAWQSEKLAAVLFCTSDCLPELRNIDGEAAGSQSHSLWLDGAKGGVSTSKIVLL